MSIGATSPGYPQVVGNTGRLIHLGARTARSAAFRPWCVPDLRNWPSAPRGRQPGDAPQRRLSDHHPDALRQPAPISARSTTESLARDCSHAHRCRSVASLSMNRVRKAGVNPRTLPQARDFAITPARPFRARRLECTGLPALSGSWPRSRSKRNRTLPMNLAPVGRGSRRAAVPSTKARLARRLALPGSGEAGVHPRTPNASRVPTTCVCQGARLAISSSA